MTDTNSNYRIRSGVIYDEPVRYYVRIYSQHRNVIGFANKHNADGSFAFETHDDGFAAAEAEALKKLEAL